MASSRVRPYATGFTGHGVKHPHDQCLNSFVSLCKNSLNTANCLSSPQNGHDLSDCLIMISPFSFQFLLHMAHTQRTAPGYCNYKQSNLQVLHGVYCGDRNPMSHNSYNYTEIISSFSPRHNPTDHGNDLLNMFFFQPDSIFEGIFIR